MRWISKPEIDRVADRLADRRDDRHRLADRATTRPLLPTRQERGRAQRRVAALDCGAGARREGGGGIADHVGEDAHPLAHLTAEQRGDRLVDRLAEDVPEGDVDRAERRAEDRAAEVRVARDRLEVVRDQARIAPDVIVREIVDRLIDEPMVRPEPALARTDEPRIGVDAHDQAALDQIRRDARDLHGGSFLPRAGWGASPFRPLSYGAQRIVAAPSTIAPFPTRHRLSRPAPYSPSLLRGHPSRRRHGMGVLVVCQACGMTKGRDEVCIEVHC